MRKLFTLAFLLSVFSVSAQTNAGSNASAPKGSNAPVVVQWKPIDLAAAKRAAIVALNKHYTIERDKFEGTTTIKSKVPFEKNGIRFFTLVVMRGSAVPEIVGIHMASESESWRFLKYSKVMFIWDTKNKDFPDIQVRRDVFNNGTVLEQMVADFTIDEFKEMAHAKEVGCKIGSYGPYGFSYEARDDWRALASYLAALRLESATTNNVTNSVSMTNQPASKRN